MPHVDHTPTTPCAAVAEALREGGRLTGPWARALPFASRDHCAATEGKSISV